MEINGAVLIGNEERLSNSRFEAHDASSRAPLAPLFSESTAADVEAACHRASEAFVDFSTLDLEARARFLEKVAQHIRALGDALILRAMAETGLPRGRRESERARTTSQLELFATVVREGAWLDVTIDPALPDRQ